MKRPAMRHLVPLIAAGLLLLGTGATVYVQSFQQQEPTGVVTVNGVDVTYEELVDTYPETTITGYDDKNYTGVAMTDVLAHANVAEPAAHSYKFVGADGYSKQVKWKHVQHCILVGADGKRVIFSGLPKQSWVRDLIEITVI